MNINTVKTVVGLVTGVGAGTILGNAVRATTPPTVTRLGKITITIGTFFVGSMVGDITAKYATGQVDALYTWIKGINT